MNSVNIIGNLGADPEVRYGQSGKAFANLRIAVNDGWGDNKKTYWFNVICFDKTAEAMGQYANKGTKLGISGRLVQREWEDQQGNKRQTVEIHANAIDLLGGNGNGNSQGQGTSNQSQQGQQPGQQRNNSTGKGQSTGQRQNAQNDQNSPPEDDIPF